MHLAENPGLVISVREMAEEKKVPYAFARSIQRDLIDAGLVITRLGASGGALLARNPEDINLYEIVTAIQGSVSCSVCKRDPEWCENIEDCPAHEVWEEIDMLIKDNLEARSLADLVD